MQTVENPNFFFVPQLAHTVLKGLRASSFTSFSAAADDIFYDFIVVFVRSNGYVDRRILVVLSKDRALDLVCLSFRICYEKSEFTLLYKSRTFIMTVVHDKKCPNLIMMTSNDVFGDQASVSRTRRFFFARKNRVVEEATYCTYEMNIYKIITLRTPQCLQ